MNFLNKLPKEDEKGIRNNTAANTHSPFTLILLLSVSLIGMLLLGCQSVKSHVNLKDFRKGFVKESTLAGMERQKEIVLMRPSGQKIKGIAIENVMTVGDLVKSNRKNPDLADFDILVVTRNAIFHRSPDFLDEARKSNARIDEAILKAGDLLILSRICF